MTFKAMLVAAGLTLFGGSVWASAPAKASAPVDLTLTAGLQAYCGKIAKAVESGQLKPRLFVDLNDGSHPGELWQEFRDQKALDAACEERPCVQEAWIYSDKGKIMLAAFTFGGAKADWANNVDYYFYLNGKIAKNHSEMRRQGAIDPQHRDDPPFLAEIDRTLYFDRKGRLASVDKPLCYRVTAHNKDLMIGVEFAETVWPQYKSAQDLPIAKLLKPAKPKR